MELLLQVARLYGVTVDELLSGQRMRKGETTISMEKENEGESEEECTEKNGANSTGSHRMNSNAAWSLSHARHQFDKAYWILAGASIIGLLIYVSLYYALGTYTGSGSWVQVLHIVVNVIFLRCWLLTELLAAAGICWGYFHKLNAAEQQDPEQSEACGKGKIRAVRRLLLLLIVIMVCLLPIYLGREYTTQEMWLEKWGDLHPYSSG